MYPCVDNKRVVATKSKRKTRRGEDGKAPIQNLNSAGTNETTAIQVSIERVTVIGPHPREPQKLTRSIGKNYRRERRFHDRDGTTADPQGPRRGVRKGLGKPLPEPMWVLACGPIWTREQLDEWKETQ